MASGGRTSRPIRVHLPYPGSKHLAFFLTAMGRLRPLRAVVVALGFLCSADAALRGGESGGTEKSSASSSLDPLSICLLASVDEDIFRDESGEMIGFIPVRDDAFKDGVFVQDSHDLYSCPISSYNSTCFIHHISRRDRIICELCRYRPPTSQSNNNSVYTNVVPCRREVNDIAMGSYSTRRSKFSNPSPPDQQPMMERNLIYADSALGNNPSRWMASLYNSGLLDTASLNDLVLPGSHNSAAVAMESEKHCGAFNLQIDSLADEIAQNQDISLEEQLKKGMRFLDLRVIEHTNFHGIQYPLHHAYLIHPPYVNNLYDAFSLLEEFLDDNPMETVIVRVDGYAKCREEGKDHTTLWKAEISRRPRLQLLVKEHLSGPIAFLKGKALIDVSRSQIVEDWPGPNFGADTWDDNDGPFEYGKYFKHKDGLTDKFTVWPFFPNIDEKDIGQTLANPFFDGLEEWDVPYANHMWMMDSLIGLRANNVNAIMTDRVGRTKVYDVATRLSLYRLFEKKPLPSKWDAVLTQNYVNIFQEEFEHHCPPKYVLQGLYSYHDNGEEDRRWKYACRRVDWLDVQSYCGGSTGWQKRQYHPSAFRTNYDFLMGSINESDGDIRFYWEDGQFALTGMGGKYSKRSNDRRFYFYAAKTTKEATECSWTPFVNTLDGIMDFQIRPSEWIAGVISQHSNWNEDRRWKFYVCR